MFTRAAILASLVGTSISADTSLTDDQVGYIKANTIGIFYHELAHAVIDLYDVPIRVKEEDAADTFSILLVDYGFDDASGESIANDIAFTFSVDAETSRHFFWNQHSSDAKRSENTICLFAGGDVDGRIDLAQDWDMTERDLDRCADEREAADDFWIPFLEEMTDEDKSKEYVSYSTKNVGNQETAMIYEAAVRAEVEEINKWLVLPQTLDIRVEPCDEANAFYDPEHVSIVMCTEFAVHLAKQVE